MAADQRRHLGGIVSDSRQRAGTRNAPGRRDNVRKIAEGDPPAPVQGRLEHPARVVPDVTRPPLWRRSCAVRQVHDRSCSVSSTGTESKSACRASIPGQGPAPREVRGHADSFHPDRHPSGNSPCALSVWGWAQLRIAYLGEGDAQRPVVVMFSCINQTDEAHIVPCDHELLALVPSAELEFGMRHVAHSS